MISHRVMKTKKRFSATAFIHFAQGYVYHHISIYGLKLKNTRQIFLKPPRFCSTPLSNMKKLLMRLWRAMRENAEQGDGGNV
jgi:hypothetical protein